MEWILNVARAEEAAEAAAQESAFSKWFSGVFAKFAEVSYTMWIGLAALVVLVQKASVDKISHQTCYRAVDIVYRRL